MAKLILPNKWFENTIGVSPFGRDQIKFMSPLTPRTIPAVKYYLSPLRDIGGGRAAKIRLRAATDTLKNNKWSSTVTAEWFISHLSAIDSRVRWHTHSWKSARLPASGRACAKWKYLDRSATGPRGQLFIGQNSTFERIQCPPCRFLVWLPMLVKRKQSPHHA